MYLGARLRPSLLVTCVTAGGSSTYSEGTASFTLASPLLPRFCLTLPVRPSWLSASRCRTTRPTSCGTGRRMKTTQPCTAIQTRIPSRSTQRTQHGDVRIYRGMRFSGVFSRRVGLIFNGSSLCYAHTADVAPATHYPPANRSYSTTFCAVSRARTSELHSLMFHSAAGLTTRVLGSPRWRENARSAVETQRGSF